MNYRHAYHAGQRGGLPEARAAGVRCCGRCARKPAPASRCWTPMPASAAYGSGRPGSPGHRRVAGGHRAGCARNPAPALADYLALAADPGTAIPGSPAHRPGAAAPGPAGTGRPADLLRAARRGCGNPEAAAIAQRPRRWRCICRDGYEALGALLPPATGRGLVLIDPPFEQQDEAARMVAQALQTAAQARFRHRGAGGVVSDQASGPGAGAASRRGGSRRRRPARTWWRPACGSARRTMPHRLNGSGLLVVNPPFGFEARRRQAILAALCQVLGEAGSRLSRWNACRMNDAA